MTAVIFRTWHHNHRHQIYEIEEVICYCNSRGHSCFAIKNTVNNTYLKLSRHWAKKPIRRDWTNYLAYDIRDDLVRYLKNNKPKIYAKCKL